MPPRPNWFVGLPVDDAPWLDELLRLAPTGLRRFHPADLHATVAFLGPCGRERAEAAWAVAARLVGPELAGELGAVVPMGPRRRPSAYALEVTGDPVRAFLAAARGPLAEAAGAAPDRWKSPRPHVTVCRPGRRAPDALRAAATAWAEATPPLAVPIRFTRLALYGWSEDRRDRLFRIVAERPLGAD